MNIQRLIVGPISTNCYLAYDQGELAVIDPGEEADHILKKINEIGAKLKFIINTHYHFDHVTANDEIKQATGALVLIHSAEAPFIDFIPDRWLEEDDIIDIGSMELKVINTPGHTPGSICLYGNDYIFTGDTLFQGDHGRTDLAGGSAQEMSESLRRLSSIIKPKMTVYPGHGNYYVEQ